MNLLYRIDQILLGYTERLARFIYRWIGVNNFGIARSCVYIAFPIRTFGIFWGIRSGSSIVQEIILGVFSLAIFAFMSGLVNDAERDYKPGFLNRNRIKLKTERIAWNMFTIYFLYTSVSHCILIYQGFEALKNMSDICSTIPAILVFWTLPYFMSIEPEPPSESKLKKGIDKLKSIRLFSEPLPNPA